MSYILTLSVGLKLSSYGWNVQKYLILTLIIYDNIVIQTTYQVTINLKK